MAGKQRLESNQKAPTYTKHKTSDQIDGRFHIDNNREIIISEFLNLKP